MSGLEKATGYVDRGDPAAYDLTVGDMTNDGNWQDWDLSGIVDSDAKAVVLRLVCQDNIVGKNVYFRTKGNSNTYNISDHRTIIANQVRRADTVVALDANQQIQYNASNTTWSSITVVVAGWWR